MSSGAPATAAGTSGYSQSASPNPDHIGNTVSFFVGGDSGSEQNSTVSMTSCLAASQRQTGGGLMEPQRVVSHVRIGSKCDSGILRHGTTESQGNSVTGVSPVHDHLEKIMEGTPQITRNVPSSTKSAKFGSSWRSRPFTHQDSSRSLRSMLGSSGGGGGAGVNMEDIGSRETSFIETEQESSSTVPPSVLCNNDSQGVQPNGGGSGTLPHLDTPMELLAMADPTPILTLLQDSIVKHKQLMGNRHKCTPSVRLKQCTHHCVEIMSARLFCIMSHSSQVQAQVVSDGHIKILVDALDPNHDPVSILTFHLQIQACDCCVLTHLNSQRALMIG